MKCTNCGSEIEAGEQFCGSCGTRIIPEETINKPTKNKPQKNGRGPLIVVLCVIVAAFIAMIGAFVYFSTNENSKIAGRELVATVQPTAQATAEPNQSAEPAYDPIDSQITGLRKMMADGDYISARYNIDELYTKNLNSDQMAEVNEINATLISAQNKIDGASEKNQQVVVITPQPMQPPQPPKSDNTNVIATYYVVNCNSYITLRSAPATSAAEIIKIPLGKAVGYIENAGNGFYKINCDGAVGYALASYLSDTKSSGNSSTGSFVDSRVINAQEFVTLRKNPSTSAEEVLKIPAGGFIFYKTGSDINGFSYVMYHGATGYVLSQYVQK